MITADKNLTFNSRLIIKLVSLTWAVTKITCYKLWLSNRLFPLIPVHDSLENLPAAVHTVLFIISLTCLLALLIFPNRKIIILLIIAELLSCMLDQNRWQPWEYQFLFMAAAYVFVKEEKNILFSWQLIFAAIFFFSGLSKFNSAFIHDVWQNLMLRRWLGIHGINNFFIRLGYLLPLIEMIAGLLLLNNRARKYAAAVLITMHILILSMLGPFGLNINIVIWPWNIAMAILLYLLFIKTKSVYNSSFIKKPFGLLIIVCWCLLPWLRFAGYWDKYLSSVLYSGGVEQLYICTSDPQALKEMAAFMDKKFGVIPCSPVLSVYQWGSKEIRTSPYPESRIYKSIIRAWNKRYPGNKDHFYLYKPGFSYTVKEISLP